ncbi:MAG TPA: type 2 isopentenyl-diphosphate Delta-isomerase [Anaerolineae bacterium]|nr:type 2 isopentenyl-diphosphate Delta-isomerase [Anaerolineae bacterium]
MLERRKSEHLEISLDQDVASRLTSGLEAYQFEHCALPEIDLAEVDTATTFLGKQLSSPILISSMTGGTREALRINRHLAEGAQAAGIALGLGSLRLALEAPEAAETYRVRPAAPDVLLLANLGAAQLGRGMDTAACARAVELVEADGLILHLNPLQEALQEDGDTDWRGILARIEGVCRSLPVPVIVKEVGWGISAGIARSLANAGVAAIDVAGAGGTSWSQVEMHRASGQRQRRVCAAFASWGLPTAEALVDARAAVPTLPLIASGGLRDGIDLAKALALGADLGGMARPFLQAANVSAAAVAELAAELTAVLRTAMFCLGIGRIAALKGTPALRPVRRAWRGPSR